MDSAWEDRWGRRVANMIRAGIAVMAVVLAFLFGSVAASNVANDRFQYLANYREHQALEIQDAALGRDASEYGSASFDAYEDEMEREEDLLDEADSEFIPMAYEIILYVVLCAGCVGLAAMFLRRIRLSFK